MSLGRAIEGDTPDEYPSPRCPECGMRSMDGGAEICPFCETPYDDEGSGNGEKKPSAAEVAEKLKIEQLTSDEVGPKRDLTVWDYRTLAGITLEDAYRRIDRDMGKNAYSKLNVGGKELTDIKSAYVYDLLSEVFGPIGIGWGYDLISAEYLGNRQYKAKSGRMVTEHGASARVIVWYAYVAPEEFARQIARIGEMTGGATNEQRNYAESGAITNAIGKCVSFFGVQRHIYMNADATVQEPESTESDPLVENLSMRFDKMMKWLDDPDRLERKLKVSEKLGHPKSVAAGRKAFLAMDDDARQLLEMYALTGEDCEVSQDGGVR